MAFYANKYPDNIAGKFYVDDQCIDCDLCRETAPDNFTRNEDGGYSYVFKQPTSSAEETLCKEAQEGCPVEAIGSDGDTQPAADVPQAQQQNQ
jgi:ferredoxin